MCCSGEIDGTVSQNYLGISLRVKRTQMSFLNETYQAYLHGGAGG